MKRNWASELRAIAEGRLLLNVRNGVTVSRSMLAMIADEIDAERAAHAETLERIDRVLRIIELPMCVRLSDAQDIIEAARRVREGGSNG